MSTPWHESLHSQPCHGATGNDPEVGSEPRRVKELTKSDRKLFHLDFNRSEKVHNGNGVRQIDHGHAITLDSPINGSVATTLQGIPI